MQNEFIVREQEIQALRERVAELEKQLAEARTAPRPGNGPGEEWLKEVVTLMPFPLMIHGADGSVFAMNQAWAQLTGALLTDVSTLSEWRQKAYREEEPEEVLPPDTSPSSGHSSKWKVLKVTSRLGEQRFWDFHTAALGADSEGKRLEITLAVEITDHKKAEEALAESERRQREITRLLEQDQARLATILQHLPVGVWIIDQNGRLIGSNEQADRIWAGEVPLLDSPAEYQKYVAWNPQTGAFLEPDDYPVAVALRTGQPVEPVELGIRRFDGSRGTVLVSAVPIKDHVGRMTGVVSVNVDITDRKQAEEALRESQERFAKLFHSSPDAIALSRLAEGLILEVNEGWQNMFGHELEEVIGRTSVEIGMYADPGARAAMVKRLQETGSLRDFEVEVRRKSGESRQASFSGEQIEIGGEECLLVTIRDITERKQAEQALRESEGRFHSLADSMPQLVWTALPDGTVDYYNARHQEYREIRQLGAETWEWAPGLHPDDLQPTVNAWQHSVATGDLYQIEHRVRMADGSYRWHLSRGVPMLDEEGRVTRWFGTATDIHDLKMAEMQLKDYASRLERSRPEQE